MAELGNASVKGQWEGDEDRNSNVVPQQQQQHEIQARTVQGASGLLLGDKFGQAENICDQGAMVGEAQELK